MGNPVGKFFLFSGNAVGNILIKIRLTAICPGESLFLPKDFFRASQQEKIGKNHATAYAFGAPIRPRHLVPTQQGVETWALA
ncbi:hypothetical protein JT25_018770 [Methylomonas denitrificans]|uniref:Uncharacterized protein n=1 Tax=Methylomonas denitrificans TaxID=1538553 RepID=A0A126T8V1_9GAMM|nr:hypothetical protein JT25_018770 [Methylomonas denitrificans]